MDKSTTGPSTTDQLKAILVLPFSVVCVIPFILYNSLVTLPVHPMGSLPDSLAIGLGSFFLTIGLLLFVKAVQLFIQIGKGTLAPWNPTKQLVVKSLYRHVRNPMILGVVLLLLGEAFLFRVSGIFFWAIFFFLLNHVYFYFKEEPDLLKRFGEEYREYKKQVPRWIPRFPGWKPEKDQSS